MDTKDLEDILAAAVAADRELDRLYSAEPPQGSTREVNLAWEASVDRAIAADRQARNRLLAALDELEGPDSGDEPVAVVTADGRIATRAIQSDGLVLVDPSRVVRLDRLAADEARAMVGDLAEQLRVRRP